MPAHIMLDLETLGTAPGSVIRSIGAVAFDPDAGRIGDAFYANVDRASCEASGLTVDPQTVAWWERQGAEAQAALNHDPRPIGEALDAFTAWWRAQDGAFLWGQGSDFDVALLAEAYRRAGRRTPWPYHAARDTRTVYQLAGVEPDRTGLTHHHALDDARAQAGAICRAWPRLSAWREVANLVRLVA